MIKESMAEKATRYMEKAADLENEVKQLKSTLTKAQSGWDKDIAEVNKLKAQNKPMWEALMCLPGAMEGTTSLVVCEICSQHLNCKDCIIDKAIREGMGG